MRSTHEHQHQLCSCRTVGLLKQFPADVTVTVITGNYYDEQLPSALNKVSGVVPRHPVSLAVPARVQVNVLQTALAFWRSINFQSKSPVSQ